MDLFTSKQSTAETVAKTAAGKISNGAAIVVNSLAREPAKGLLQVVSHIQKSVPGLIETQKGLDTATLQLQAVLAELQDAQEGVCSITSPATRQDLDNLAASISQLQHPSEQQQQLGQQLAPADSVTAVAEVAGSMESYGSSIAAASNSLMRSITNPANLWRAT